MKSSYETYTAMLQSIDAGMLLKVIPLSPGGDKRLAVVGSAVTRREGRGFVVSADILDPTGIVSRWYLPVIFATRREAIALRLWINARGPL